jgi:hypothetical protein
LGKYNVEKLTETRQRVAVTTTKVALQRPEGRFVVKHVSRWRFSDESCSNGHIVVVIANQ